MSQGEKWVFFQISGIYLHDRYPHRLREFDRAVEKLLKKITPENPLLITGRLFEYDPTSVTLSYMNKFFQKLEDQQIQTYVLDPEVEKIFSLVKYKSVKILKPGQINGVDIAVDPVSDTTSGICISATDQIRKSYRFSIISEFKQEMYFGGPGNFIQRNKYDELAGSYAIWDYTKRAWTTEYVFPRSGFLTLRISEHKGRTKITTSYRGYTELPDIEAVYVEVVGYDEDEAENVKAKYGRIDKIVNTNNGQESEVDETKELLKWLENRNTEKEIQQGVMELHKQKRLEKFAKSCKFKLHYLEFENILCFKRGFIEFDKKMLSLEGPNKSGKSSILDILTFILFNKSDRYERKNMIRNEQATGIIRCVISNQNGRYLIERSIGTKEKANLVNLTTGENLSCLDLTQAYRILGEITGSYSDFININIALQHRTFFSDLKSAEIQSMLLEYLSFNDLDELMTDVKIDYRELNASVKTLQAMLPKDPIEKPNLDRISELTKQKEQLAEKISKVNHNRKFIVNDIKRIKERLGLTGTEGHINKTKVLEDQKAINEKINELTDSISMLKCLNLDSDFEFDPELTQEQIGKLCKKHSVNPEVDTKTGPGLLSTLDSRIDKASRQIKYVDPELMKTDSAKFAELTPALLKQLETYVVTEFPKLTRYTPLSFDELKAGIRELEAKIDAGTSSGAGSAVDQIPVLKSEINIMRKRRYNDGLAAEMSRELSKLSGRIQGLRRNNEQMTSMTGGIKFCITCPDCNSNKKLLFTNNETEISKLDAEMLEVKNRYTGLIEEEKVKQRNDQAEIGKLEAQIQELQKKQTEIDRNRRLILDYRNDIAFLEQDVKVRENNRMKSMLQLRDLKTKYETAVEKSRNNEILNSEIADLKQIRNHVCSQLSKKLQTDSDRLKKLRNRLENMELITKLAKLETELEKMPEIENADDLKFDLISTETELNSLISKRLLFEKHSETMSKLAELEPKLEILKVYKKALGSGGIRNSVLNNVYPRLSNVMNRFLSKISDTSLEFDFSKAALKVYAKTGTLRTKAKTLSGSQRFIIDIAFRIALIQICEKSPILIIDEGFGCLDQENLDTMKTIFAQLRNRLDLVMLISHVPFITSDCTPIKVGNPLEHGTRQKFEHNMRLLIEKGRIRIYCNKHRGLYTESHFHDCKGLRPLKPQ